MLMVTKRWCRYCALASGLLLLTSCSSTSINPFSVPSALDPHGPSAARLANLWWVMLAFGAAVWVFVIALLVTILLQRRRGTSITDPDSEGGDVGRNSLTWGGIVLPLIVVSIVFGFSIYTFAVAENIGDHPAVKIEVVGRRWWWEIKYPDQEITTANEIHIPVGVPVEIKLESADVIHSFWVPQLNGKVDLVPAEINHIKLQADQVGVYHGQCAEYCGLQHAHMGFLVFAQSNEDFNKWLAAQQQPAPTPTNQTAVQGQLVFKSAGCVFCHPVDGLDEKDVDRSIVDLGPDLTHIHSRRSIAASTLINTRGNLAGWIVDAQHVKPGSLMPNMRVNSQDLQALLAYLETLE
jgi:cytochrome c oxidase subunit II